MGTFLLVVHITVCLFLIFIVLVQGGKGAEMGAAFGGGGSQTLFGGRGAATFLGKLTTGIAVVFMVTSLLLALVASRGADKMDLNLDSAPSQEAPLDTQLPPAGTPAPGGATGAPESTPIPAPSPSAPAAPAAPDSQGTK